MKRALVLSLAVIFGLGIAVTAQTLSGEWTLGVEITTNDPGLSFAEALDFSSELTVTYEVGGWTFSSMSGFDDDGWFDQDFTAAGSLGAWTFSSAVDFDPADQAFGSWVVTTGIALGGMTFGFEFSLHDSDVALEITGAGSTSLVDIEIEVYFGDITYYTECDGVEVWVGGDDACDLNWSSIDIEVGFPFCCADIAAELEFNCAGFEEFCVEVAGITVPNLPWFSFDAEICFTTQTKTMTITPAFDFGADVCFDLYISDTAASHDPILAPEFEVMPGGTPFAFGDFELDGIGLTCEIGGIAFSALSYWGEPVFGFDFCALLGGGGLADIYDYPGILAGYDQAYWEAYQIATTDDACCGPFAFDITVFFSETAGSLFDIALFVANMEIQVASQFEFGMGLEYEVGGAQLWTIDFTVTW